MYLEIFLLCNYTFGLHIVMTMIGVSKNNRTSYQEGVQSRTDAYI